MPAVAIILFSGEFVLVVGNGGLDVDGIDDDDAVVVAVVSTTPLLAIDELEEFRDGGSGGLLSSPFDAPCVLFCSSNVGMLLLLSKLRTIAANTTVFH